MVKITKTKLKEIVREVLTERSINAISKSQQKNVENIAKALELYKNQEWKKAIEAFKASDELEDMFPGRKTNPSRIYIPRCEHFMSNSPGDDWDGVWTLTSK